MNTFRLKSYLTFLGRNKLFTLINLFGFTVSLAVVILLGLYLRNEYSVDRFHEDHERIWRLSHSGNSVFSAPLAEDIKNRYPEIESITRVAAKWDGFRVEKEGEMLLPDVMCVDSSFFDLFSFPFLEEDPDNQLQTLQEITLSESFSVKAFGNESALGKSLRLYTGNDTVECIVTGIVKDFRNTHFRNPDLIVRFENVGKQYLENNNNCSWQIYLKTSSGSDLPSKMPDMLAYFKTFFWLYQQNVAKDLFLRPLTDCHFDTQTSGYNVSERNFLSVLTFAMFVILLFAVINYINLSVAQSGFRAKEAAIRGLLGSSPRSLFVGFILESVLFCTAAALLAVLWTFSLESPFNRLLETDIHVSDTLTFENISIGWVVIVLLALLAGSLPAWAISRYRPIEVVRGSFTRKTRTVYSRVLIIFQYCMTLVLLGSALTIMRQTHFMRTTDLGFNKENVIWMNNTLGNQPDKLTGLRNRLNQISGVEGVSFCAGDPSNGSKYNNTLYDSITQKTISFQVFLINADFLDILNIDILRSTGIKDSVSIYLNEAAAKELNLPDTAQIFNLIQPQVRIAGIVQDFHFKDLSKKIGPAMLVCYNNQYEKWTSTILVKISGTDQAQTYDEVKAAYSEYNGGIAFEGDFIDTRINSWYNQQERTYTIIGAFAVIAILIAALGMLAMATYYLRQRTAEVAIRKVFGSTEGEILRRVIAKFLKMVLTAFIIAVPIIWYVMDRWLSEYAYHIALSWTIFATAGAIALAIALISVFWQSYQATRANPVDSLRK